MKFQIDTDAKTISFEESIELDKLFKHVRFLFPNNEWKKYTLVAKVITNWWNPIVVDRWPTHPLPWWNQPFYVDIPSTPTITCAAPDNTTMPQKNIYNVSLQ